MKEGRGEYVYLLRVVIPAGTHIHVGSHGGSPGNIHEHLSPLPY